MSDRARGKNHQKGALPRKPRIKYPGRNRIAKNYDQKQRAWLRNRND